jgi:hypothetical protein
MSNSRETWIQKVLAVFNGGDEANLKDFKKECIRDWGQKVKICQRNIETIKSKLEDELFELNIQLVEAKEALESSYYSVDPDAIKDRQSRKNFQISFEQNIANNLAAVESIENKISSLKEKADKDIAAQEKNIAIYENYITKLDGKQE